MYLYHMYNKKRRILLYNRLFLNKHADICVLFDRWLLSKESSFAQSLCSFVVSFFLEHKKHSKSGTSLFLCCRASMFSHCSIFSFKFFVKSTSRFLFVFFPSKTITVNANFRFYGVWKRISEKNDGS